MGRPRTPSAILELRGAYKINPQRKRTDEPVFEQADVPCPEYLSERARAEWDRAYAVLKGAGVMTPAYLAALAGYCHYYAQWVEAVSNTRGLLVKLSKDGETIKSPYIDIALHASREYRAWAIELGLTAVSKTRVASTGTKQKENRFAKFTSEARPN